MKPKISLFIMVDACGWEIVKNDPFCQRVAPHRHKLESVFGYSSTCVPSIVSGHWPDEHRNWCYFVHDPKSSPFRFLKWLKWIPKAVTSRRIFRRWLTPAVKWWLGFKGYFDLYNIPFEHIDQFDFTEKKSPLQPMGMNRGTNIFDTLTERKIPHFVSNPNVSEEQNRNDLSAEIAQGKITFAFMYWAGLDGLLHRVGNDSAEIPVKLRHYEQWIERLYHQALEHYETVELHIFSDHSMANCDVHLDLKSKVESLPYKFGKDYAVVYDSTMARFWFFNQDAKRAITALLGTVPQGRIVPTEELKQLRAHFYDHQFGELIFLVHEGVLIVPSHMGERPIRAMHGYHPHAPHSYATLFTNQEKLSAEVTHIPHLHRLMLNSITTPTSQDHVSACHTNSVLH